MVLGQLLKNVMLSFIWFTFTSVEDSVHRKFLVTFADAVKQKMVEEIADADARHKWAVDHIKIGFTGW